MTIKTKILAIRLMPISAGVGCAFFLVLSLSFFVFGVATTNYLLGVLFLVGAIFFGLPFYTFVDPKKGTLQNSNQKIKTTNNEQLPSVFGNDVAILSTLIISGIIALFVLWWLVGIIASLPMGIMVAIIILLLIFK